MKKPAAKKNTTHPHIKATYRFASSGLLHLKKNEMYISDFWGKAQGIQYNYTISLRQKIYNITFRL